jgi:hypothetical protein
MHGRPFLYLVVSLLSASGAAFAQAATPERTVSSAQEVENAGRKSTSQCMKREADLCTECAIDVTTEISIPNKTRTPLPACYDMKPGPARLVLETHAEPVAPGLWEVEFGLGYKTSTREECPHQYIASNNPPLRPAYEIGPISIESEIPADGAIQILLCVGLSSAQVGQEGRETGASLKISRLRVVSQSLAQSR